METTKLNFIKQGAMTRNINQDEFMRYLATQRENGGSLASWSIAELKGVTPRFLHPDVGAEQVCRDPPGRLFCCRPFAPSAVQGSDSRSVSSDRVPA